MDERRAATPLPPDLEWVNTDVAPCLDASRGRVVLLWFWSYDNVNSWNLMPLVRRLEDSHHDGLVVIGVHCPKFPRQRDGDALLRAVNRHRLRHPIANDRDFRVWRDYAIQAWPSIALVDAAGRLAAVYAGEGRSAEIEAHVGALLDEAAAHDLRVYEPAEAVARPEPRAVLAFPAGLLVDEQRLFVADSGHDRVLECSHDGRVLRAFGSGNAGHADGVASLACFRQPHGLARKGQALYVADTGNHCVRRVDLVSGEVDTVLGTARAGRARPVAADAPVTALNTPIGLAVIGDDLFVAIAGQHQVWRFDLATRLVSVLAGTGDLGLVDGSGSEAAFAQPSGLAAVGRELVVADAASSAIRAVDVDTGRVATVVGHGLYAYGDASGTRAESRLQYPLAVAIDPRGLIYVADSCNDAVRLVSRRSGETRPLRMTHPLREPHALGVARNTLFIANTNQHEIVAIDLGSGALRRVPVGET
ncbi:thioredoxin-like domain-containing protein [Dokdonella sp.]|uniref:thioredoxin-like domain-containing protein n=1 Tax=Dokdonella sp. TaxID=2291710 RepID=UPI002F40F530